MNTNTKRAELLKYLCLGLSYVFSYIYIRMFLQDDLGDIALTVLVTVLGALAILWVELSMKQQDLNGIPHSTSGRGEVRFWEGTLLLLCLNTYFGFWPALTLFLIHLVIIYMVLCGTGHLLADRSSVLLPFDLMRGVFSFAVPHFFSRLYTFFGIRTAEERIAMAHTSLEEDDDSNSFSLSKIFACIGIILFVLIIFSMAFSNLATLDGNFASVADSIDDFLANLSISNYIFRFILSVPVGAFLFALFQNCVCRDREDEVSFMETEIDKTKHLRFLPSVLACMILGLFIVVYLAFYISQASYMFSGFAGVLPEAYTASEYAVSGFMELIRVVLINFVLMAVLRIFASRESRSVKVGSITLMIESCVFAAISASKIILYMSRFGFTESRTLGLWGTIVVFAGAICTIVHLVKDKKTFAPWLWFSVGSYVAMQFLACPFIFA